MKKNKFSFVGFNLIMISGGLLCIYFLLNIEEDWLIYLSAIIVIIGVFLSLKGKSISKNEYDKSL